MLCNKLDYVILLLPYYSLNEQFLYTYLHCYFGNGLNNFWSNFVLRQGFTLLDFKYIGFLPEENAIITQKKSRTYE